MLLIFTRFCRIKQILPRFVPNFEKVLSTYNKQELESQQDVPFINNAFEYQVL